MKMSDNSVKVEVLTFCGMEKYGLCSEHKYYGNKTEKVNCL